MRGLIVLFVAVIATLASFGEAFLPYHHDHHGAKDLKRIDRMRMTSSGPEKCCLHKQWSAHMTVLGTINNEYPTVLAVQMDYDRKQQAMLNYTGGKTPLNKVVIDYTKHIIYWVPTNDTKKCIKAPLPMPMIRCIPDDAEFLGNSFLGPMGAGQLSYNGWRIRASVDKVKFVSTLAVSKDGCAPIVEGLSISYPQYPSVKELYLYSGYKEGLTDPSVFNLPESCN